MRIDQLRSFDSGETPQVTVLIVRTRFQKPLYEWWFEELFRSLQRQAWGRFKVHIGQNVEGINVGKAWNIMLQHVDTPFVFFLGDDDTLGAPDVIFQYWDQMIRTGQRAEMVTGKVRTINPDQPLMDYFRPYGMNGFRRNMAPTGLWKTDFLKKHPFDATKKSGTDTAHILKVRNMGRLFHSFENHDYCYRIHPHQISKDGENLKLIKQNGAFQGRK